MRDHVRDMINNFLRAGLCESTHREGRDHAESRCSLDGSAQTCADETMDVAVDGNTVLFAGFYDPREVFCRDIYQMNSRSEIVHCW